MPWNRSFPVLAPVLAAGLLAVAPAGGDAGPANGPSTGLVAASYRPTAADRRLARVLSARTTGTTGLSGAVIDAGSNRVVWSRRGTVPRMPASTAKLVTATAALRTFGPDHRFTTTVRQGVNPSRVMLVGAGDPSLSTADLGRLARDTATSLRARKIRKVTVRADDSLFPRPTSAVGWRSSYVPDDVRPVRALVVDGHHARDTSLDAARVFAAQLRRQRIQVVWTGKGRTPRGARLLARARGDRLSSIVTRMLLVSDNDHAEALYRLVAVGTGRPAGWGGAEQATRVALAGEGISLARNALRDGSGLSRADRLSAVQLARVADNVLEADQPELAPLRGGALPVAGRTGTLSAGYGRFSTAPSRCAAGKVVAKTGTLRDVVALAGWTRARDGRVKAFAFVINGPTATRTLKQRLDAFAATVNGCY